MVSQIWMVDDRKRDPKTGKFLKDPTAYSRQIATRVTEGSGNQIAAIAAAAGVTTAELLRCILEQAIADYADDPAAFVAAVQEWVDGGDNE